MTTIPTVPGPRWWTTLQIARDPFRTYLKLRKAYGDTFIVRAINGDVVVTADPNLIRDLFRARTHEVAPFRVEAAEPLLGRQSLLVVSGDQHRRERELLTPPFHGRRMHAYGQIMQDAAERATAHFRPGANIVLSDVFLTISLDVIVRAVFGMVDPAAQQRWEAAIRTLVKSILPAALFAPVLQFSMFGLSPWDRFIAARDRFDALIVETIAHRRATNERGPDLLSLMLDATYDDGSPMTDRAIRDELVTMLFAGHETTQIAMAWAVYRLLQRPDALERLLAELDASDGAPETLATLPWLDAVVQETLRLQPIVPDIVRTLTVDLELGGHAFAAGTHVAPVAALVHARDDLFPDPDAFRPERFVDHTFRPWELLPFGGGVRRCIGAALATWEMKVVLGTVLPRWSFALRGPERAVRRNITMGPKHGVRVTVCGPRV
ncbi:MAG: cytochrome P450 [Myxococcota bacterium]